MDFKEIETFAADVREALRHLSAEQVAHLTEDLEANMKASVEDGMALPDVDSYVDELLAGAGLERGDGLGGRGVVPRMRASVGKLVIWYLGLNTFIRLLAGLVVFVGLTLFTTDRWTIAVVVIVVSALFVARTLSMDSPRRRGSIAIGVVVSLAVAGWAFFSESSPHSDPFGSWSMYCATGANLEQIVLFPTRDVPDLVGKSWNEAAANAQLWWPGQIDLQVTNPDVFTNGGGTPEAIEALIVRDQGDPVLFTAPCHVSIRIPVSLETFEPSPTTLPPQGVPGDTTTTLGATTTTSPSRSGSSTTSTRP